MPAFAASVVVGKTAVRSRTRARIAIELIRRVLLRIREFFGVS